MKNLKQKPVLRVKDGKQTKHQNCASRTLDNNLQIVSSAKDPVSDPVNDVHRFVNAFSPQAITMTKPLTISSTTNTLSYIQRPIPSTMTSSTISGNNLSVSSQQFPSVVILPVSPNLHAGSKISPSRVCSFAQRSFYCLPRQVQFLRSALVPVNPTSLPSVNLNKSGFVPTAPLPINNLTPVQPSVIPIYRSSSMQVLVSSSSMQICDSTSIPTSVHLGYSSSSVKTCNSVSVLPSSIQARNSAVLPSSLKLSISTPVPSTMMQICNSTSVPQLSSQVCNITSVPTSLMKVCTSAVLPSSNPSPPSFSQLQTIAPVSTVESHTPTSTVQTSSFSLTQNTPLSPVQRPSNISLPPNGIMSQKSHLEQRKMKGPLKQANVTTVSLLSMPILTTEVKSVSTKGKQNHFSSHKLPEKSEGTIKTSLPTHLPKEDREVNNSVLRIQENAKLLSSLKYSAVFPSSSRNADLHREKLKSGQHKKSESVSNDLKIEAFEKGISSDSKLKKGKCELYPCLVKRLKKTNNVPLVKESTRKSDSVIESNPVLSSLVKNKIISGLRRCRPKLRADMRKNDLKMHIDVEKQNKDKTLRNTESSSKISENYGYNKLSSSRISSSLTDNIGENTSKISDNCSDMKMQASSISDNRESNTSKISDNCSNMRTQASSVSVSIGSNTSKISDNCSNMRTQAQIASVNKGSNTSKISDNCSNMRTQAQSVSFNTGSNTSKISNNCSYMRTQAQSVSVNIRSNTSKISDNCSYMRTQAQSVSVSIGSNTSKISDNCSNMRTQAQSVSVSIGSNTSKIPNNCTNMRTQSSGISVSIGSNTSKISDNCSNMRTQAQSASVSIGSNTSKISDNCSNMRTQAPCVSVNIGSNTSKISENCSNMRTQASSVSVNKVSSTGVLGAITSKIVENYNYTGPLASSGLLKMGSNTTKTSDSCNHRRLSAPSVSVNTGAYYSKISDNNYTRIPPSSLPVNATSITNKFSVSYNYTQTPVSSASINVGKNTSTISDRCYTTIPLSSTASDTGKNLHNGNAKSPASTASVTMTSNKSICKSAVSRNVTVNPIVTLPAHTSSSVGSLIVDKQKEEKNSLRYRVIGKKSGNYFINSSADSSLTYSCNQTKGLFKQTLRSFSGMKYSVSRKHLLQTNKKPGDILVIERQETDHDKNGSTSNTRSPEQSREGLTAERVLDSRLVYDIVDKNVYTANSYFNARQSTNHTVANNSSVVQKESGSYPVLSENSCLLHDINKNSSTKVSSSFRHGINQQKSIGDKNSVMSNGSMKGIVGKDCTSESIVSSGHPMKKVTERPYPVVKKIRSSDNMKSHKKAVDGSSNSSTETATPKGILDRVVFKAKSPKTVPFPTSWGVALFRDWLSEKRYSPVFEDFEVSTLDDLLMEFYSDIKVKESSTLFFGALYLARNAIISYLTTKTPRRKHEVIQGKDLMCSNALFEDLNSEIKTMPKQLPIRHSDMKKLYQSEVLNGSDPVSLQRKVWFEIVLNVNNKWRNYMEALHSLKKDSVVLHKDGNRGHYCIITPSTIDKYSNKSIRIYEQLGEKNSTLKNIETYLSKLNPLCEAFFQRPLKSWRYSTFWYKPYQLGKIKLSCMMSEISADAKLSRHYTNSAVKATSTLLLQEK